MTQGRTPSELLASERGTWLLLRAFAVCCILVMISDL
jgi:hypothetical protein